MKILHRFYISLFALLTAFSGLAAVDVDSVFSYGSEEFSGLTLNYRKAVLGSDADSCRMIVIYLHGGSGQGNDNKAQMKTPAVTNIYSYLKGRGMNCVLLVPQVPFGQQWMGIAIPALRALADKYSAGKCSPVYILGASMGGNGVWNMLTEYPGYFAGAMPVACDTPKYKPEIYDSTRIISVIGGDDKKRDFNSILSFFNRLKMNGPQAEVEIVDRWGHRQTCEWSFSPARLDRLFR